MTPWYWKNIEWSRALGRERWRRQRFVEAMRELNDFVAASSAKNAWRERLRWVAEAFADAVCGESEFSQCGYRQDWGSLDHAACRAALLKEIFGE